MSIRIPIARDCLSELYRLRYHDLYRTGLSIAFLNQSLDRCSLV